MNLDTELELSLYEELKTVHKSKKTEIILVYHTLTSKFYIKRILREYAKDVYEKLSTVKCINIPHIINIFELDNKLIVIEEFINGETLQQVLENEEYLNENIVIEYMIELCEILDILHKQSPPIIHRDIKPENIIISNDKVLKLIDFDISRTYKEGENLDTTLLGTKGYASPEQFGFEQTDGRSDIYAMGVMMNVLTTGKHIKEYLNEAKLRNIIIKCTKISPEERYNNVEELKYDLINLDNKNYLNFKPDKYNNKNATKSKSKTCLPGFRTGNKRNMILASILYILLSSGLFVFDSIPSLIGNIILIIMSLMYIFLFTNFMDINSKLPIINNDNKYIRYFGFSLYSFIIFMSLGSILTFFT